MSLCVLSSLLLFVIWFYLKFYVLFTFPLILRPVSTTRKAENGGNWILGKAETSSISRYIN